MQFLYRAARSFRSVTRRPEIEELPIVLPCLLLLLYGRRQVLYSTDSVSLSWFEKGELEENNGDEEKRHPRQQHYLIYHIIKLGSLSKATSTLIATTCREKKYVRPNEYFTVNEEYESFVRYIVGAYSCWIHAESFLVPLRLSRIGPTETRRRG